MATVQLTVREQIIERVLRMPDEQVAQLAALLETLANDPNWGDEGISAEELERRNRLDQAAFDETEGEPTRPFSDFMDDLKREGLYP